MSLLTMSCPAESRLCDLAEGLLPAAEAHAVDMHLDACPSCRRLVSEVGKLVACDDPAPQARLGRYERGELIAAGGMGVVHEAFDPALGRTIAIKILDTAPDSDQLAEARALAQVRHPGVVAIHDVGIADGRAFIAMEYIRGEPLHTWARHRRRSWCEVVDVMIAAGHGLAAIHASELTHGDFKPSNVLVGNDGRVQVIDFGLATLTRAGYAPTGGTPGYLAPELLAGASASYAADQYSFCVTFATLVGKVPRAIHRVIARGRHSDPSLRHPDVRTLVSCLERTRRRSRIAPLAVGAIAAIATTAMIATISHDSLALAPVPAMLPTVLREPRLADVLAPMLVGDQPTERSLDVMERAAVARVRAASRDCITATITDSTVTYRGRDCRVAGFQLTGTIVAHYRITAYTVEVTSEAAGLMLENVRLDARLIASVDRSGRMTIAVWQTGRGPLGGRLESSRYMLRSFDSASSDPEAERCSEVDERWSFMIRGTRWSGDTFGYRSCPGQYPTALSIEYSDDDSQAVVGVVLEPGGLVRWRSSPGLAGSYLAGYQVPRAR